MISKDERQNTSVNNWEANDYIGVFWHVTGFGKSVTAVKAINRVKPKTVLILMPREVLVEQWKEALVQWLDIGFKPDITVMTVQDALANNIEGQYDLLIVDELHLFFTVTSIRGEGFSSYIDGSKIQAKMQLGLTATYKLKSLAHKRWESTWPVVDRITRREAIDNEWISPFTTYNLIVQLSDEERKLYDELSATISSTTALFTREANRKPNGFELARLVVYGGYDDHGRYFSNKSWATALSTEKSSKNYDGVGYEPGVIINKGKAYLEAIQQRKQLLETGSGKFAATRSILSYLRPELSKTIVFSESTKFVDRLEYYLFEEDKYNESEVVKYHSNMESQTLKDENGKVITYKTGAKAGQPKLFGLTTLKTRAINMIKTKQTWLLLSARALDVGLDVDELEIGIATSGRFDLNQNDQRIGRIVRKLTNKHSKFINLVFSGTLDEVRAKSLQKDEDVIWVTEVDNIFNDDEEWM